MDRERERTLAALRDFEAACATARQTLRSTQTAVTRVRRQLERDDPLAPVILKNGVAAHRVELTDTLAALEEARRHMRMACFRLGLQEGASIGELARLWGFSRQLASRYAHEALATTNTSTPA
jgi:hypothetical protein